MTEKRLEIPELGTVEYVVSDGVIYEPTRDNFGSEWYFVRRGEFDDSQLEGESIDGD